MVYAVSCAIIMTGVLSFAVDWGRIQLAKSELQAAADAAARYGAKGLATSTANAKSYVASAAADNKVAGTNVSIDTEHDIEFGTWDPDSKQFVPAPASEQASATALRVTARRASSRSSGLNLYWGALWGRASVDLSASAVATRGHVTKVNVPADSCPWLAGLGNGAKVVAYDGNWIDSVAPDQSPVQAVGVTVTAGATLSFRQVEGVTAWDNGSGGSFGPDGDTGWIVRQQSTNGINATSAPIQCLVGIFLDNSSPNSTPTGAEMNFSSYESRDFSTLAPGLKQVFFIGDGVNSAGQLQKFTVPAGATRLYLGLMDEKGWWWDNYGTVTTTVIDQSVQSTD